MKHKAYTRAIAIQENKEWGRTIAVDDEFIGGGSTQHYTHDFIITIKDRTGVKTRYHLFVKNDKRLIENRAVQRLVPASGWKGDVVVLRKGTTAEFVSMRAGDVKRIDYVVRMYVPFLVCLHLV
ncbi:hypothetical protein ONZ45_g16457 [Pleurotus djamor]|nr:hypothetical protein ONZ45_g16457 [Pleurotus djamor]